jgi:hypothetical protein
MSTVEEVIKQIDDLIDQKGDRDEMFSILEKAHATHGDEFEILWRFARAHFMKSEIVPHEKQYEVLVSGQKLAQKCIDIDKKHYAGYKWFNTFIF